MTKTPTPVPLVLVALRGTHAKLAAAAAEPCPNFLTHPKEEQAHHGMMRGLGLAIREVENLIAAVRALHPEEI